MIAKFQGKSQAFVIQQNHPNMKSEVLPWSDLEQMFKLRRFRTGKQHTLGISWCSLSDSSLALNSCTLSLCVFEASLATRSSRCKHVLVCVWDSKEILTRFRCVSSNLTSAGVFFELDGLLDEVPAGDSCLLPGGAGDSLLVSTGFDLATNSSPMIAFFDDVCDDDLCFFL